MLPTTANNKKEVVKEVVETRSKNIPTIVITAVSLSALLSMALRRSKTGSS
jgi:hypothetical protein